MTFPDPKILKGLHLFCNPYSNCAERAMLVLAEKGLVAEIHVVDLMKSEQLCESYLLINENAEVPSLIHDGKVVMGSVNILRYVEDNWPQPSLVPERPDQKAAMDALLDLAETTHLSGVANYIYAFGFGRLPTPEDKLFYDTFVPTRSEFHTRRLAGDVAGSKQQAKAVIDGFAVRLERALKQGPWLVGEPFSLADLAWFPSFFILQKFGYQTSDWPLLNDWMRRMQKRQSFITGVKPWLKPVPDFLIRFFARNLRRFGGRR